MNIKVVLRITQFLKQASTLREIHKNNENEVAKFLEQLINILSDYQRDMSIFELHRNIKPSFESLKSHYKQVATNEVDNWTEFEDTYRLIFQEPIAKENLNQHVFDFFESVLADSNQDFSPRSGLIKPAISVDETSSAVTINDLEQLVEEEIIEDEFEPIEVIPSRFLPNSYFDAIRVELLHIKRNFDLLLPQYNNLNYAISSCEEYDIIKLKNNIEEVFTANEKDLKEHKEIILKISKLYNILESLKVNYIPPPAMQKLVVTSPACKTLQVLPTKSEPVTTNGTATSVINDARHGNNLPHKRGPSLQVTTSGLLEGLRTRCRIR